MNSINYNLSWGRKVVLLHDYFPLHVLHDLDSMIATDTWQAHPQPHRQCMSSQLGDTALHLLNHTGHHVSEWVGRALKLSSWQLWRDTEGLTYNKHTDLGLFRPAEYHMQIYLGSGCETMGTRFYNNMFTRTPTIQLSYTRNAGYFMARPQLIYHSVAPVPKNQCRLSVIARYRNAS
jgi:hypothetical protein